jgi:2,4-dienoyl-CoA reductase (NADPH2)
MTFPYASAGIERVYGVTPEQALADGDADMVSMARPFLADPDFMLKASQGKRSRINTCIACNQGCLDKVFNKQRASCLVNPRACYETELSPGVASITKKIIVIGLGPAGMACATAAAQRGHMVTAYDLNGIGGQLNYAVRIPGKQEFNETLRYFRHAMEDNDVVVKTGETLTARQIKATECDAVVIATGVKPRMPQIEGIDHESVVSYIDVITQKVAPGKRVAIIGAGGIGFDVATLLIDNEQSQNREGWLKSWNIDIEYNRRGGLLVEQAENKSGRKIYLLQRKQTKPGKSLGKTTGWIHRVRLRQAGVEMLSGVCYEKINDQGLFIHHQKQSRLLDVDQVIICAGQESNRNLADELHASGMLVHVIGGADKALELDAERAIRQGYELALKL